MSNLSELLPAGAGAKSADFVASGTISSGVTVAINSNGTVSAISGTDISAGSSAVFESGYAGDISAVFDSNSNKVVVAYRDGLDFEYGKVSIGTVSGTSISFGTPTVFYSGTTSFIAATYTISSKVVIAYVDVNDNQYGKAVVGTVSGTTISFGSVAEFHSVATDTLAATYDTASNKVIIAYEISTAAGGGEARVGTVSGTGISFGTAESFNIGDVFLNNSGATFDSNSNKVIIAYRSGDEGNTPKAVVGTVSGTNISFGTSVFIERITSNGPSVCFDSNSNKIVAIYSYTTTRSTSQRSSAIVGTVSGTSISFGTPSTFIFDDIGYSSIVFDSNLNKALISYRRNTGNNELRIVQGEVISNSFVFDSILQVTTGLAAYTQLVFDDNSNKVVVCYYDGDTGGAGNANVITTGSTNCGRFIGISDQAIADTATGKVIVRGAVSSKVLGLTNRAPYYVQPDGTLATGYTFVPAGRALSTTSILLEG